MIRFDAVPVVIEGRVILRLPDAASKQLPSRGQVAVRGTINGFGFDTVIEPDGAFGHWLDVDRTLQHAAGVRAGGQTAVELEVSGGWPEPSVPDDLWAALEAGPLPVRALWEDITPMARWEWVRWVNATRNPDTRRRRVEVTISKLNSGKRRPCCFNLASCTDPDLAKSGRLMAPPATASTGS